MEELEQIPPSELLQEVLLNSVIEFCSSETRGLKNILCVGMLAICNEPFVGCDIGM